MSITDIMKLQGVGGANRVASGDAASIEARKAASKSAPAKPQAKGGIALEMSTKVDAGQPPVEADRVEQIRNALQDGSYPIVPAEIADAMIAARLSLVVTS